MCTTQATGLGEPEMTGKRTLFRPPTTTQVQPEKTVEKRNKRLKPKQNSKHQSSVSQSSARSIRATIELTSEAFFVVQTFQNQYRVRTGKSLPLWKALSEIIEFFGKSKGISP